MWRVAGIVDDQMNDAMRKHGKNLVAQIIP